MNAQQRQVTVDELQGDIDLLEQESSALRVANAQLQLALDTSNQRAEMWKEQAEEGTGWFDKTAKYLFVTCAGVATGAILNETLRNDGQ